MPATPNTNQIPARKDRTEILTTIKKLVSERHINVSNPTQDYGPWLSLVDARTPRLLEVEREVFEAGVTELLGALGSSHTVFFHQRPCPLFHQRHVAPSRHGSWQALDVRGCDRRWCCIPGGNPARRIPAFHRLRGHRTAEISELLHRRQSPRRDRGLEWKQTPSLDRCAKPNCKRSAPND